MGQPTDLVDHLKDSDTKFQQYLQSYTTASVALLNRWPTFVPEDERFADTLKPGTEAAVRVFGEPPDAKAAEEALRGLVISGVGSPRTGAGGSTRPASSGKKEAAPSLKEEALRDKVERLSSKLRHEVSERSKANDEAMRRGLQLQSIQRDNAALQESVRRQAQQLEHARETTLRLEAQHREFVAQVETADARLVKERKLRHTWQLRAEKYQRRIEPLEAEATVLKESLSSTVTLLQEAQSKNSSVTTKAVELSRTNQRLGKVTDVALKEVGVAREDRAQAGLQLSLMADRRDELLETIDGLKLEGEEHTAALDAMEAARNAASELAQEERRLRAIAEGRLSSSANATEAAYAELTSWRKMAESREMELHTQKAHVETLLTQDAIREAEQRRLFESVSELLARVQYLGELTPESMGMSKAEALQHKDEAIRHLRALRESHALSTSPPQLYFNQTTVATGAGMLSSAPASARGGPASPRVAADKAARAGGRVNQQRIPPPAAKSDAAAAAADGALPSPRQRRAEGFDGWRAQVAPTLGGAAPPPPARTTGSQSARAAERAPAKVAATDWEKRKLVEMMNEAALC